MLNELSERTISCPYCGEFIEVLLDPSEVGQQYIEDCQVCCKPINFSVFESNHGELEVTVFSDDSI